MITVRSATPADMSRVYEVLAAAFGPEGPLVQQIVRVMSEADTRFRFDHLRVAEVDGHVASLALLIPRQVHVGTRVVDGMQVSPVGTDPAYERRGLCSAVMRDAVAWMKAGGYDLSLLWGIPWLYPHYGYSSAMPGVRVGVELRQAPERPSGWEMRSLAPEHLPAVQAIYHDNTRARTCAELRTAEWWEWRPWLEDAYSFVVLDPAGAVRGYCQSVFRPDYLEVYDAGIGSRPAAAAILAHLAELGRAHDLTRATCNLPPDHPLSRAAFWHDAELQVTRGHAAGMVRVLNLPHLLLKIRPELEQRLASTEFAWAEAAICIASDEAAATLRVRRGNVTVEAGEASGERVFLPLARLNPLITGFQSIRELAEEPGVEIDSEATLRLLEALFPTGHAHWPLASVFHE